MKLVLFFLVLLLPLKVYSSESYNRSVETIGDVGQYLIPGIGLVMSIKLKDRMGAEQFIMGGIAAQLTSAALKYSTNVKRPNNHDCSFPSGHTTMAFFGAGFINKRYGWKYGFPALVAAGFVGYSRWQIKKHWVSDIVAGAAIGLFYNWLLTTPYRGKMCVYPVATRDSFALCCDYQL